MQHIKQDFLFFIYIYISVLCLVAHGSSYIRKRRRLFISSGKSKYLKLLELKCVGIDIYNVLERITFKKVIFIENNHINPVKLVEKYLSPEVVGVKKADWNLGDVD